MARSSASSCQRRADRSAHLHLPATIRQMGLPLLDCQMWCWGQDIRYSDGNLLLAYGARKDPTPDPRRAASRYHLALADGAALTLWSFGLGYRTGGGALLLRRAHFRLIPLPPDTDWARIWRPEDLPERAASDEAGFAWKGLATLAAWAAEYEEWVRERAGADWRARVIAAWPDVRKARGLLDAGLAESWRQLAAAVHALAE